MNRMVTSGLLAGGMALVMSGCGTPGSYQEAESTTGAALGAGVGLVAGAALHRPMEGMAAGALIGGGTGSAVGQNMDEKASAGAAARQVQAAQARVAANPPVSKDDVIMLTKANVSEDVIVNKVNSASYVGPLTAQDIVDLKNAGVSDKVTNAMLVRSQNQASVAETAAPPQAGPVRQVEYYWDPYPGPYVIVAPPFYRHGPGWWR